MGLRELAKAGGARCATSRAARRSEAGARGGAGLLSSAAAEGAARSGARWHPQKPAAAPYSVTRLAGAPPAAARPVEERGETQATLGGKGVPSGGAVRRSRPTAAHARRLQQRRWPTALPLACSGCCWRPSRRRLVLAGARHRSTATSAFYMPHAGGAATAGAPAALPSGATHRTKLGRQAARGADDTASHAHVDVGDGRRVKLGRHLDFWRRLSSRGAQRVAAQLKCCHKSQPRFPLWPPATPSGALSQKPATTPARAVRAPIPQAGRNAAGECMASDTAGRLCQIRPAHAQTRPPTRKASVGCWGAGELGTAGQGSSSSALSSRSTPWDHGRANEPRSCRYCHES